MVKATDTMLCACKSVGQDRTEKEGILDDRHPVKKGAIGAFDCKCVSKSAGGTKSRTFSRKVLLREDGFGDFEI